MRSHTLEYQIFGDDMQIIEIELDPVETLIAEAGAMNYMEDGISFET
ncbi:MAG TPA: AIM24 family protein, partial [Treponemataceae bacterium]|nr:AIM24 family protein [Treponemataceae bacterium]